jgi:hypothetical protein
MPDPDSKITTDNCNQESMSYYLKTRETINGLDQFTVTFVNRLRVRFYKEEIPEWMKQL